MNTESVNLIKDHVLLLQEKYNESLAKINEADIKGEDSSFYKGQNFAYYDALELIKSQVEAFGYNSKEVPVAVPEFGKPATLDAFTKWRLPHRPIFQIPWSLETIKLIPK